MFGLTDAVFPKIVTRNALTGAAYPNTVTCCDAKCADRCSVLKDSNAKCADRRNVSKYIMIHMRRNAWMKLNQHRETLLNRHVSLKLRLKFFDSIISLASLFGLATVPLLATRLSKLDFVRRRMLRSIVGWVPVVNGDWHDAMSKMHQRLENAYRIYPKKTWPERIQRGKFRSAATKIACKENHWPVLCSRWQPGKFVSHATSEAPRSSTEAMG